MSKKFLNILCLSLFIGLIIPNKVNAETTTPYVVNTDGCKSGSMPTYLDLNRCSEEEIRNYYSSLNTLDDSNKSGINVLQYIKPILYEMNYFSYSRVEDIYAITDRDWTNSPTLTSGTYDALTNTVTNFNITDEASSNPYIKMLYVDYTKVDKTPLLNESSNNNFDKEHVWCQSRGFKAPSGASGPAGTDLHHLISGDSYVNQQIHNNNPYGFVNEIDKSGNLEYTSSNKKGTILHTSTSDQADTVFEPMDEYKGDIARAIFYMMARYNNISGTDTITQYEPNLNIANYATSNGAAEASTATTPVSIGILSDLLAWNKLDPVDEFEIYRNDLIYRNFQGNRNPFIDFPEWIDAIWGTSEIDGTNYDPTPKGKIDPLNDTINGVSNFIKVSKFSIQFEIDGSKKISATASDNSIVTWSIKDPSIISISANTSNSNEEITVTALKAGKTTLTASFIVGEETISKDITITVLEKEVEPEINYLYIIVSVIATLILMFIYYEYKKNQRSKKKSGSKLPPPPSSYIPYKPNTSTKKTTTSSSKSKSTSKKSSSTSKKTTTKK